MTELILVLTVLLALLAVLAPSVYRWRGNAKTTACSDNLNQLGIMTARYLADVNNQTMPAYEDGWVAAVSTMAPSEEHKADPERSPRGYWECPSQDHESLADGVDADAYWRGSNYGINQHIASKAKSYNGTPYPAWALGRTRDWEDKGAKVLIADSPGGNYHGIEDRDPVVAGLSQEGVTYAQAIGSDPARPLPYLRHVGGAGNFLFADGHVEALRSYPSFTLGPGTAGYKFWHAEHAYPGSGKSMRSTAPNAFGPDAPTDRRNDGVYDQPIGGGSRTVRPPGASTGNL